MDENEILTDQEEVIEINNIEENLNVVDDSKQAIVEEETQAVEVEDIKVFEVGMEEAFPPVGESNARLRHTQLTELDVANQHPIEAIEGLRSELNDIEALKTLKSNGENVAYYYPWKTSLANNDNGYGYFVSFYQKKVNDDSNIPNNAIIKSSSNIIGVTVSPTESALIGNEIDKGRDDSYVLVCMSGRVKVRILEDVVVGDRVIPCTGGYAERSNNGYGYNVTSIENNNGIKYAVICLVPQSTDLFKLRDDISDMENRLDVDEANIAVAINTANNALQSATNTESQVSGQVTIIQGQVQSAINTANTANTVALNANESAILAQSIAESAQVTAQSIQSQVTSNISNMENDIKDIIDSVEPLTTWTSGENTGASYLVDHIQNNLATKVEVNTVNSRVDDAFTVTEINAKLIQNMAMIEHKYSVGPHSPSDGLIYDDTAEGNKIDALPIGIVYVPTVDVVETTVDHNHTFTFYQGNSYEWNGVGWDEYEDCASMSNAYITGNSILKYWYVGDSDITHNDIIYPAGSLCLWSGGMWVVVANIKDYANFHVASRTYQSANTLGAEIANARGDCVSLDARLENDESSISQLTSKQGEHGTAITSLQTASINNSAYIENIAMFSGDDLVQSIQLDSTPTGIFYINAPIWNDESERWIFSGEATDTPISPCYAQNPDNAAQYYQYTCGSYNIWFRNTRKYSTSMAVIKQAVDSNSASISQIVSAIGNEDGEVNAASIIAKVNGDSSNIEMSADRIKLNGGTIDMATNKFTITAGNGFKLDENGISWNTASNPTKMVYSQTLITKPTNGTLYSTFDDDSVSTWHKNISINDKYASETTDGGTTWSAVRKIVGDDGSNPIKGVDYFDGVGVSSIKEQYIITDNKTIEPAQNDSWQDTCPAWEEGKYIWHRTKVTYTDDNIVYVGVYCDSSWEAANVVQNNLVQVNAALIRTSKGLQSLVANVATYNVGKVSPSYNMSYDDAILLMSDGAIYVPTVDHYENLIRDEIIDKASTIDTVLSAGTLEERENGFDIVRLESPPFDALDVSEMKSFHFESNDNMTYCYTWNGAGWIKGSSVSKSTTVPTSGSFWLCPIDIGTTYKANTLYVWDGHTWIGVASERDSTLQLSMSAIRQTASSISSKVSDIQGNFSLVEQTANSISQIVQAIGEDGEVNVASIIAAINNNESSVTINADKINLGGYVTVSGDEGITAINGDCITTGNIKSSNYSYSSGSHSTSGTQINLNDGTITSKNFSLDGNGLKLKGNIELGGSIFMTGNIVWKETNNPVTYDSIAAASYNVDDASGIYSDYENGKLRIRINADYINAGTIDSERINTDAIYVASSGAIKPYNGATNFTTTTGVALICDANLVAVTNAGAKISYLGGSSEISCQNGSSKMKYNTEFFEVRNDGLYATTSTISTSDREKKKNISSHIENYENFYMSLQPVKYKFEENQSERYHIGFIAQDVESAINEGGITTQDFAGYCKWTDENNNETCGLRYEEFIALNTHMIQKLYNRIDELENKIIQLEEKENG